MHRRLLAILTVLSSFAILAIAHIAFGANTQSLIWQPAGPGPNTLGQVEEIRDLEVEGAVEAIAVDPHDPKVVYIGAVNGGIWKSTNATDPIPVWRALTDTAASLSIGALEFDPLDSTRNTLVAGFGNFSSYGLSGALDGVLRTTDGGTSWQLLGAGSALKGLSVTGLAARGATFVVATNTAGVLRSTNSGSSWDPISGAAVSHLPAGPAFDLMSDPADPAVLFTNGGTLGLYRSQDTGATWTKVSSSIVDGVIANADNVRIAVGSGKNVFVAITVQGQLAGLFRAGNWGATGWAALDLPKTVESGTAIGINPGGQGKIHLSIAADPQHANIVYIGGDRQPCSNETSLCNPPVFPNSIRAKDFSGRLFRVDASRPKGSQATPLTHSYTKSGSAPHADSRRMRFSADGSLLEADDGGLYRRTSPQNATGDWDSAIGNLQVSEVHSAAWDSNAHMIIGGAQDTGTPQQHADADLRWESVSTGDGGVVLVNDTSNAHVSARYSSFYSLLGFRRQVFDSANKFQSETQPKLLVLNSVAKLKPQFYTPMTLNSVDATRLIIGAADSVYESMDEADSVEAIGPGIVVNPLGPIAYGARNNADALYLGSGSQVYIRSKKSAPLAVAVTYPGTFKIMGIAIDRDDAQKAFVVDAQRVYTTTNGGSDWNDITHNLASLGPGNLLSIAIVASTQVQGLAVGTSNGALFSAAPGYSSWTRLGTSLPNAMVMHLQYSDADSILLAATLGRGAWLLRLPKVGGP